jgi:transcriptional regulator with XRE-family HTH domain
VDLETLGAALRERREALGIPRTELARRVGVTPTYVWLVEGARPRKGGKPSRAGQAVIERWARSLGMDDRYTRQALVLAGHLPEADQVETPPFAPPPTLVQPSIASSAPQVMARVPIASATAGRFSFSQAPVRFSQPPDLRSRVLQERLRELLALAEAGRKWEETADLVESLLEWLRFRLAQGM